MGIIGLNHNMWEGRGEVQQILDKDYSDEQIVLLCNAKSEALMKPPSWRYGAIGATGQRI